MPSFGKKLAILHARSAPRGGHHHMVALIAEDLEKLGVDVIHLYGTSKLVPADAIFVHVDLSVVPEDIAAFARRYPLQINGAALDIRKRTFADGLLYPGATYDAPVIVKSDLNYGGAPEHDERNMFERAARRLQRTLKRLPPPVISSKSDYRIFPTFESVPLEYYDDAHVIQKLILEKDEGKNILREYMFLGNMHYENIERSEAEIITEDEHVSCLPFTPHPRLIEFRNRLKLDYGKIDYVMVDGAPFIFDANKTIGVGHKVGTSEFGEGNRAMLRAFAIEIHRILGDPAYPPLALMPGSGDAAAAPQRTAQSRPAGPQAARA